MCLDIADVVRDVSTTRGDPRGAERPAANNAAAEKPRCIKHLRPEAPRHQPVGESHPLGFDSRRLQTSLTFRLASFLGELRLGKPPCRRSLSRRSQARTDVATAAWRRRTSDTHLRDTSRPHVVQPTFHSRLLLRCSGWRGGRQLCRHESRAPGTILGLLRRICGVAPMILRGSGSSFF